VGILRCRHLIAAALVSLVVSLLVAPTGAGAARSTRGGLHARLRVEGVATRRANGQEVRFSGTLRCRGGHATGTGDLEADAKAVCRRLARTPHALEKVGGSGRVCAEVYGGPQEATIRGTVNSRRIDVHLHRRDSCGIDDWNRVEFLLGRPER